MMSMTLTQFAAAGFPCKIQELSLYLCLTAKLEHLTEAQLVALSLRVKTYQEMGHGFDSSPAILSSWVE